MKTTDKIMLSGVAAGAIVAGGLYYLDPGLHWGWYAGVGFVFAAGWHSQGVKHVAAERLANRDISSNS
nr:hypothetical protein [Alcaligenes faecalis]